MDELDQLAEFISLLSFDDLPHFVVERARDVLRDTFGVMVGGVREPEVAALAEFVSQKAPGSEPVFGTQMRVSPPWAAFVNGTAGTTLEMDEGHAFARGHAAIHAIPPALALAPSFNASGRDLITAIITGYEVAARVGIATRLRPPVHPFGTWGVLGAAAVAGWYKKFDRQSMRGTLELAASYAINPSFETAYQGATVRNTYAGMVNRLGMEAADMYALGFRGERGGVSTTFGEILGESFTSAELTNGLGTSFEIMRGYFKPYSGCRYTHGAIEAVLKLRSDQEFEVQAVDAITVETYDIAARLVDPAPQTPLAARFSMPYVVAATLVVGSAGPEIFTPEHLMDPEIRSLAARVTVAEDPEFTALTPEKRPAKVTLSFGDGSHNTKTVFGSKGDPDQPMSLGELEEKFMQLCGPTLGIEHTSWAWSELGQIANWSTLASIGELFAPVQSEIA